ncbi:hypothetical protein RDWZM_007973 [Blomia tropicalis]|uniref:Threonylcarbamoyl-AMP synthase n=1 Tax=Blomia tropicalis TaxID=40697 RepID=A0A9Q0RJL9_BLOTA|nr:hypothetical protein BLOT_003638 [Blomia tropicalis]KAJ6216816.1 hypothetical protein RDWZM_007973 [Blomia tropicalis]
MAKVFTLNGVASSTYNSFLKVAQNLLLNDQIIAIPTDTIYGLAVNANCQRAIQRLYSVKKRDNHKPFAICVADIDEIFTYGEVNVPSDLLRELLPGAVTVLFRRSQSVNACLNPNHELVGIRIPDYPFVRDLCRISGPIALTSANITNESSCLNVKEFQQLWPSVDAIFDGGQLGHIDPQRLGSTIIDLSNQGYFKIQRSGCVLEQTLKVLYKYGLKHVPLPNIDSN